MRKVLREALDVEQRIADAVARNLTEREIVVDPGAGVYSPYDSIARDLDYQQNPTRFPAPFFTTLDGYAPALGVTVRRAEGAI